MDNEKCTAPVFIIGCPRTGSKIYLNAISNNSDVNISPELHILNPFWLHSDFRRKVKNEIGIIDTKDKKRKLLRFILEGDFFGTFWKSNRLNIDSLSKSLDKTDGSVKEIINSILVEDAYQQDKRRIGAKFPVHFSRLGKLIEWYPNAKIIHLTRNPCAIYNSQLFKYYNNYKQRFKKYPFRILTLLYVIFIYKWDYRIHKQYKNYPNYFLSRYEDVVLDFEKQFRRICDHIDIGFDSNMKNLPLVGSSFSENRKSEGINHNSIDRYKKTLNKFEIKMIQLCCSKEMKQRGYL